MRKLMLSLAGFRSAFGVMSAYRDVAAVVTGPMGVPGGEQSTLVKVQRLCLETGIRSTSTPRTCESLCESLARFRSTFGVKNVCRGFAAVVTGSMGSSGDSGFVLLVIRVHSVMMPSVKAFSDDDYVLCRLLRQWGVTMMICCLSVGHCSCMPVMNPRICLPDSCMPIMDHWVWIVINLVLEGIVKIQPKTRATSWAMTEYDVFDETMVRPQTSSLRSRGRARAARCAQNVEPSDVPISDDYKEGRNDHSTRRHAT
ncbi:Uncharacterized protein TCM_028812 [Theobroma cacao]|uniref:Uncharacterized protein n=1 Tax=Theobroma cacao TaxID=3641 RepID=A0A061GCG2_THECC|nr:Uncharacterized protein TCM_028812 [Theobroma cacao]